MPTVAEYFVEFLKREGVRYVFGVPGGQPLAITDAIYDEPGIEFVATRHENGAAHAADAMGRLTGTPGVCLATTGPGATNLITGVGGALRDSSPMICVTVNNARAGILRDDAQDADHVALFTPLTRWSVQVNHPAHAHEVFGEAFQRATAASPGPVHIDFTRDVLAEDAPKVVYRRPMSTRIEGDDTQFAAVAEQVRTARRPVLWLGNGVKASGAGPDAVALSERLDIPLVTTFNGIGAIPTDHPNAFGVKSRMSGRLSAELLAEADLLIAVGNSLNGPSTSRWTATLPDSIVQIDIDAAMIGRHYPQTVGLWADARAALRRLADAAASDAATAEGRAAWLADLRERRARWHAAHVHVPGYDEHVPIKPQALMKAVAESAPADTVYSVDAGNPGIWSNLLPITAETGYMKPVGFGNMAFSLPAAIAAKLAFPERPVICLVGDGSLGMSIGEIETAVRCGAAFPIVVLNDMAYGNIKQEQLDHFGPRYIGVEFTDAKYAEIAKGFGADGERVTAIPELRAALGRALAADGPYLIDTLIDGGETVWNQPF